MLKLHRNAAIAGGVVLLHVGALWVLQTGLLRRAADVVVPVRLMSETVAAPQPQPQPQPLVAEPQPARPVQKPFAQKREEREQRPPARPARVSQLPVPRAPASVLEAQPQSVHQAQPPAAPAAAPLSGPRSTAVGDEATAAVPGASAKVEPPSSHASYLQNPALAYPPLSKRLGEEGKVIVRVLIGADGLPQKAELKRSSGFERLDQSALEYVMKCRYVPGKVGGVPQAMWHEAPVSFVLQ